MPNHDLMPIGYSRLLSLEKTVAKTRSGRLSTARVRREFQELHDWYMDGLRPILRTAGLPPVALARLDGEFEEVISCSTGRARKTAGTKLLKKLRSSLEDAEVHIAPTATAATEREGELIAALRGILPTASASYDQALRDLGVGDRLSYRGVAAELREVLREVLDQFAPDDKLPKSVDGRRPTMKDKVRFILRARDMGDTRRGTAESVAQILDDGVPNLARSVYDLGSLDTHVGPTREEVTRLRRYLEALLLDLIPLG